MLTCVTVWYEFNGGSYCQNDWKKTESTLYLAELKQASKEKFFWIINVCQKCFETELSMISRMSGIIVTRSNILFELDFYSFVLVFSPASYDLLYSLLATFLLTNPYVTRLWSVQMDWIQIEPTYRFCKDSEITAHTRAACSKSFIMCQFSLSSYECYWNW